MNIIQVPAHPNNFSKDSLPKKGVVLHWIVGELSSADVDFQKADKKASAHYGIGSTGVIHQYVADIHTAFHAGRTQYNLDYIGIEHAGGQLIDGVRKKPTLKAHDTSAALIAALSEKYGWGELEYKKNVFKHSDVVATLCCGTLDVEYIINKANEIINSENMYKEKYEALIKANQEEQNNAINVINEMIKDGVVTEEQAKIWIKPRVLVDGEDAGMQLLYRDFIKSLRAQLVGTQEQKNQLEKLVERLKNDSEKITITAQQEIIQNLDQYIDPNKYISIQDHLNELTKEKKQRSLSVVTTPSKKWSWNEFAVGLAQYGITDIASAVTVIATLPNLVNEIIGTTQPALAAQINTAIIAIAGVGSVIVSAIKSFKKFAEAMTDKNIKI